MPDLDNDNGEITRHRRRTALVALETERYGIKIAALSEIRLLGEGALLEDVRGYTFYWNGLTEGQSR